MLTYTICMTKLNLPDLSRDMGFSTMWYVRPAKAQTILRIQQSDQSLCLSLEYSMTFKHDLEFLSLTGGRTGSSESIHVKMPHCWKSRVAAQFALVSVFRGEKSSTVWCHSASTCNSLIGHGNPTALN